MGLLVSFKSFLYTVDKSPLSDVSLQMFAFINSFSDPLPFFHVDLSFWHVFLKNFF